MVELFDHPWLAAIPVQRRAILGIDSGSVLPADNVLLDALRSKRTDRLQNFDFFVAHSGGIEGCRRFHGHQRSQLQDMALNHVTGCARGFVERRTLLDAQSFRCGDLNVIHIVAVPQRLENAVAKTEHHQVLDRVFAQVVVDAVNLRFVEGLQHGLVQLPRRSQVAAVRFLDNDSRPGFAVGIFCQAGFVKLFDNSR